MKNKTIAIFLTAVLAIAATACGNTPTDAVPDPAVTEEQSVSMELSGESSGEESTEESVEEESAEDGVPEDGKSFAYMMDDDWYEPFQNDFNGLRNSVGMAVLELERGDLNNREKLQEWDQGDAVMSDLVRRWEEESFESQGSYTWEQFKYDIYKEYNIIMPNGWMCKIGDSYFVTISHMSDDYEEIVEYDVNDWYDRYVFGKQAEYFEELAERVGIDTTSDEFCDIFRRMLNSNASVDGTYELIEDKILVESCYDREESSGDSVSETEIGKSFAYMMDDDWYEPWFWDFDDLWSDVGFAALDLMPGLDASDKLVWEWDTGREVMSDLVQRWEEDSYEGQGSYTWEQFEHDIYTEYNVRIRDIEKCKVGDSFWYINGSDESMFGGTDSREWVEWVVDDWYDRYVYESAAEYFEELAERIGIDTTSDEFCGIFRRFLNTCIDSWNKGVELDEEQEREILAEFGIE